MAYAFPLHPTFIEEEVGFDDGQAVIGIRHVVRVLPRIALQFVPIGLVFEVDGLPAQPVARPLPRVHAAVEDLEDGVLVDALVVRFVPNTTSNARLKHCRYWI